MERTDPLVYLEKHIRKPLFTKFKNQYYQTKAEEAIASTLCALLEVPIKDQIKKTIGAIIVGQMKASEQHFTSKMALKVKIFTELQEQDEYEYYLKYVRNVKRFLEKRIEHYTIEYCDKKGETGETRLQISAKEEVSRLIVIVESTVKRVNKTGIQEWLSTFSKDPKLVGEIGYINVDTLLAGLDTFNEINLDNFKLQIRTALQELQKNLHTLFGDIKCAKDMSQWKDKPHELLKDLIGCTAQCPFCREQCDLLDPEHYTKDGDQKHRTEVHRPVCLGGMRSQDKNNEHRILSCICCK